MYNKKACNKYRKTKKYKITLHKRQNSDMYKVNGKKAVLKYQQTKKGKLAKIKHEHSNKRKIWRKKYRLNNLKNIKTREKLNDLFRYNHVDKDFICAICGKQPIQKHHENYELPFVFIPLCVKYHTQIHNLNGGC